MEPDQIEPKLKRATRRLALRRFVLGRTHRATADAYYKAGILYDQHGDNDKAARCLHAAERIHRKRPGHPAVALDLYAIGLYQAQSGERRRAVQSLERAQKILAARLTADPAARSPEPEGPSLRLRLGNVLSAMADVLRELDIRGRARTCGEQALAIIMQELAADSPSPATLPATSPASASIRSPWGPRTGRRTRSDRAGPRLSPRPRQRARPRADDLTDRALRPSAGRASVVAGVVAAVVVGVVGGGHATIPRSRTSPREPDPPLGCHAPGAAPARLLRPITNSPHSRPVPADPPDQQGFHGRCRAPGP